MGEFVVGVFVDCVYSHSVCFDEGWFFSFISLGGFGSMLLTFVFFLVRGYAEEEV